ncbi:MAG TPA: Hpt domain-containing protein [Acidisarcina sp.]
MTLPPDALSAGVINMPDLLARVDDDAELLGELFEIFAEEFPRLSSLLTEAVEAQDMAAAEKAAHTLKGMLANLSAESAAEALGAVEAAARARNQPDLATTFAAIDTPLARLNTVIDACLAGEAIP